jgi:nucleoside-diphosphate-sugar epimerase
MSTHLVTGGNGFLGSAIAKKLIASGEKVIVIDIFDDQSRDKRIKFKKINILDKDLLDEAFKGVDYVHHNAALVPLKKAGKLFWEVNVEGTRNVLDAALKNNIKHLSHMSSSAVFGNIKKTDCPIKGTPKHLKAIEIYGKSKEAGEKIIFDYLKNKNHNMTATVIRPRTIIGSERLGIFQVLFEWISENKNIYIIGSGNNIFQFAHVNDLVFSSIQSAKKRYCGAVNIGTNKYSSLRSDLESFIKKTGSKSKVKSLPIILSIPALFILDKLSLSPLGPWHYLTYHKDYFFDLTEESKQLQFKPSFSNREMLFQSYKWYLKNKSELSSENKSAHKGTLKQGILKLIKIFS